MAAGLSTRRGLPPEHLRFPYIVGVLCAGILLGSTGLLPLVILPPQRVLFLFLPIILFDAAFKLDLGALLPVLRRATVLGLPGALLAAAVVAAALAAIHFPEAVVLVLAAVLAATDPISVFAVLRGLNLPGPLRTLLEGESLINDGTAVVLFAVALDAVLLGHIDWTRALFQFLALYGGGLIAGFVWGMVFVWLFQRLHDRVTAVCVTIVLAYGGYLAADVLHASGVIAVVVAGLLLGATRRVRPLPREAIVRSWDYLAFGANTLIFLLVGLQFRLSMLPAQLGPILLVVLAALAARTLMVLLASAPVPWAPRVRRSWKPVLVWGGLRGALTLALVLSLPAGFPQRGKILALTVGFVLFSMVLQGLTLRSLVIRLPLERG